MTSLVSLLIGAVFGAGLLLSGMTDPAKVIGFLDIGGAWDPSLAFVMGGAVLTAAPFFAFARRRRRPLLAAALETPARTSIDTPLIAGSAIFGAGWGLAGLCPGPAIVNLGAAPGQAWPFLVSLGAGLLIARYISNSRPAWRLRTA